MPYAFKLERRCAIDGVQAPDAAEALTPGGFTGISESIPEDSTDLVVALVCDVSLLQAAYLYAAGALTVKTYDGVSLVDTIALAAGQNILWSARDGDAARPFSADFDSLKVTNAAEEAVTLEIRLGIDPTE